MRLIHRTCATLGSSLPVEGIARDEMDRLFNFLGKALLGPALELELPWRRPSRKQDAQHERSVCPAALVYQED